MPCGRKKRTGADRHVCKWRKICGCEEGKALGRIGKMWKPDGVIWKKIQRSQGQHDTGEET